MELLRYLFILNLSLLTLDHLASGIIGILTPHKAIKFYKTIFGITIPERKEYIALLKPWCALGIFAGVVTLFPLYDPERYRGVLISLCILLFIRIGIRLRYRSIAETDFLLDRKRNMTHVAFIAISAFLMIAQLVLLD